MARSFNGTTDRIDVSGAFFGPNWFTDNYSISVWVKGASGHGNTGVYAESRSDVNTLFWWIGPDSTTTSSMRWSGSGSNPTPQITTATVFDNTPHHYLLTCGSATVNIYVDGVLDTGPISIGAGQTGMNHTGTRSTLGSLGRISYGNFFPGTIWDLAIWTSHTLSAGDAKSLAGGVRASHLAPTHYWPLWGVDSPELDLGSATHAAGTLTGTSAAPEAKLSPYLLRSSWHHRQTPTVLRPIAFSPGSVSSVSFIPAGMTDRISLSVSSKSTVSFSGLVELQIAGLNVSSSSSISFSSIGVVRNISAAIASGSAIVVNLIGGQKKVFVRHDFTNTKYISPAGPHLRIRLTELDAATDAASLPSWTPLVNDKQVGHHQELLSRINEMALALQNGTAYARKGFPDDKFVGDIGPHVLEALNDIEIEIDRLTP